jgi:EAL domain-containing protein (putative c-di-GMP-specific phosphodiesterase class I)
MLLRADLERALTAGELVLRFQPVVALPGGAPTGFEARTFWRHPTRGDVPLASFVDIAEQTGLLEPISRWLLVTAVRTAAAWPAPAGTAGPYVSVPLRRRQLESPTLAHDVTAATLAGGLSPGRLVLELAADDLPRPGDALWSQLTALRLAGVRVAVDGPTPSWCPTGIDLLAVPAHAAAAPTRAGLAVLARDVRTAHDHDRSLHSGCTLGQGEFYGPALSGAEVGAYLGAPAPTLSAGG